MFKWKWIIWHPRSNSLLQMLCFCRLRIWQCWEHASLKLTNCLWSFFRLSCHFFSCLCRQLCPQRAFHVIVPCYSVSVSWRRKSAGFWISLREFSHLLFTEFPHILVCTRLVVNKEFFEDTNLKITCRKERRGADTQWWCM